MKNIIIDEEFKFFLPELENEAFVRLEKDLIENGCRDALVLWGDILIDGHHRYKICTMHDLAFETYSMEFDSREDVLIWIINTQLERRNLTPIQLTHFRGVHYRADKQIQGSYERSTVEVKKRQNVVFQESTAKRLAEHYRVSHRTIERDAKVAAAIDEIGAVSFAAKKKILSGDIVLSRKFLETLPSLPEEDISKIAECIEDGTFEKPMSETVASSALPTTRIPATSLPSSMQSLSIISEITDAFYFELRKLTNNEDKAGSKTALRLYIDALEKLYNQM
jgi:ribosomal protein S13